MLWDGGVHVNVNLFMDNTIGNSKTSIHDIFIEKVPSLTLFSHDKQPRGFGRVVNFIDELQSHPHWASSTKIDNAIS